MYSQVYGSKHDVSQHGFVIEKVKLLKHHPHMPPVDVDVYLHIRDVNAFEYD